MVLLLESLVLAAAGYALTLALGWGLARLLLPHDPTRRLVLAPWLGIAQTGLLLIPCGYAGIGTRTSAWAAVLLASGLYALSLRSLRRPGFLAVDRRPLLRLAAFVSLAVTVLMVPAASKSPRLTGFTVGNEDILDYAVCAQYLQNHGLPPFVRDFGEQPPWPDATIEERVASWQIPAPRWLSYYYLSFLSSVTRREPAHLFTFYLALLYACFLPLLWLIASRVLELKGAPLAAALLLAASNPHILYILYNAFLPQMAATGLFLASLSILPDFTEKRIWGWKDLLLPGILGAATLAAYLEIFSFLLFIVFVYLAWLAVTGNLSWRSAVSKMALWFVLVAALSPYQLYRMFAIVLWHAGMTGGGWQVTQRYYLFLLPLGAFFSHTHRPEPSIWLEWVLGPAVLFLIVQAVRKNPRGVFWAAVASPFLISGILSFKNGWNYRFFKNFTYAYFWLPLALGAGLAALSGWLGSGQRWKVLAAQGLHGLAAFILLLAGVRTAEGLAIWTVRSRAVPVELAALEKAALPLDARAVYGAGLSNWEALWAGYHLHDRSLVLPSVNAYLRNDTGSLMEGRYRWAVVHDTMGTLFDPWAGREKGSELLRTGHYVLAELKPPAGAELEFALGGGIAAIEGNSQEQWAWMGREASLIARSGGVREDSRLSFETVTLQEQNLVVRVNGKKTGEVALRAGQRQSHALPVSLEAGENTLVFRTDREPPPREGADARPLNVQLFRVRCEP